MNYSKFLPFLKWRSSITKKNLSNDLIAGLLGAIIVLPQGIAFATIAGLPPQYGLYAAIVPAIIAALWGSSYHLVSGPTTAISLVVLGTIGTFASAGSPEYIQIVLTVTFMVGVIQLIMGLLNFGKLIDFISHTVVVGFTAGAAILIAANQIKNFFGVPVPQGSEFYDTLYFFFKHISETNPYIFVVGIITFVICIIFKILFKKIPYMIPGMFVGSLLGYYLNSHYGFDVTGIKTVGSLPNSLPPLSLPTFDPKLLKELIAPAFAITSLALIEAVAIAKAVALRSGQRINGNQEIIGQGMSNIIGSFFSAYPSSGSFNRSGLNFEAGAKTPLSSVFSAIFLSIIVLFVGPLASYIPNAVMAAILFLVAWGLIDFHHIKNIIKSNKSETALLAITFLSTLFVELELAIFVGVFLSIGLYLRNSSKPNIYVYLPHPDMMTRKFVVSSNASSCPQFVILRVDGPIFFGSINYIENFLYKLEKERPEQKYMLFVFSGVFVIDLPGIDFLSNLVRQKRKRGGDIYFSNINNSVAKEMKEDGLFDIIGEDHIFDSKPDAIKKIFSVISKKICKNCKISPFMECKNIK